MRHLEVHKTLSVFKKFSIAGDLRSALATAKELLALRPESQSVHKKKANIERALRGNQKKLLPKRKAKVRLKASKQLLIMQKVENNMNKTSKAERFKCCLHLMIMKDVDDYLNYSKIVMFY